MEGTVMSPVSAGTLEIDAKDLADRLLLKISIKHANEWIWRIRFATLVIRFVCWIGWIGNYEIKEIELEEEGEE
jgi:hypothetical protein